jgi:general secretion pathway protein K
MALLITLMIMVILAALVHRFTFTTRVHLASAATLRDQFQAECLALSGAEISLALLAEDDTPEVDHLGEAWALFKGSPGVEALQFPDGVFAVLTQDESAKISINHLVRLDGATVDPFLHAQMDRLLGLFQVPSDVRDVLLDCLEDWLDQDDLHKLNGVENEFYSSLDPPYTARNGPLRSLGELNLVKGWREVLELRLKDGTGMADYLTVGPTDGKINVNTAPPLVLQALSPEIDEVIADQIVSLRQEAPLTGPQLLPDAFRKRGVRERIRFNSSLFSIRSEGLYRRVFSVVEVQAKREADEIRIVGRRME